MTHRVIILSVFLWGIQLNTILLCANPAPSIHFIANKGQWNKYIDFSAKLPTGNMTVGKGRFTYTFLDQNKIQEKHHRSHLLFSEKNEQLLNEKINGQVIQSVFLESNSNAIPIPLEINPEYYNYFIGSDSSKWQSNVHSYRGVLYKNFYDCIDLKIYSEDINLKYDFVVQPYGDYSAIKFKYFGAEKIYLNNDGDLFIKTSLATVIEKKPVIYQYIEGKKVFVKGNYQLNNDEISFQIEDSYDPCYELVIDPLLIFSTYTGFVADNWGSTATPAEKGKLYSAGVVNLYNLNRSSFSVTPGAFQTTYGGLFDVAIYKYDSTGSRLIYTSYLGGSSSESPHSLVIDANNNLFVLGTTSSSDFNVTSNAFDRTFNGGTGETNVIRFDNGSDIFISKISPDGTNLLSSTYLGGSLNDGLNPPRVINNFSINPLVRNYGDELRGDIIIDSNGNILISSVTSSTDFPTGANTTFSQNYNGGLTDALVVNMDANLEQLRWTLYLGGTEIDAAHSIKIDKQGNIYVAGGTTSSDFPATPGAYQRSNNGGVDGWIAKFSNDGSSLFNATYTGTSRYNQIYFLDLDKKANVYVYGQTVGAFPITANTYNNPMSGQFIQKFNNTLTTLLFSTVFGSGIGIPNISPTAFMVDDCSKIYLAGWGGETNIGNLYWPSSTHNMPVTSDAFQQTTAGSDFYLMALTEDASKLVYATHLGGSNSSLHLDGGTCRFDKRGIVYHAVCAGCGGIQNDFPTTASAWSRVNNSANCNNAAFKFDLSSLKARIQTNNVSLTQPGIDKICLSDTIVFQNKSIGGTIYDWNLGDGNKQTKSDRLDIKHLYKKKGLYTVKLKAIDKSTCLGEDSTKVNILVSDPLGFVGPDQTICQNQQTQLIAGGGVTYQWKNLNNEIISTEEKPIVSPKLTTQYIVSVKDVNDCKYTNKVQVKVIPSLEVDFKSKINYNCNGRTSVTLTSQAQDTKQIIYDFGDGTTSDLPSITHQYEKDGDFHIRRIGTLENCVYDKETIVSISELKIPNVFTPEQSIGSNDTFQIMYGDKPISSVDFTTSLIVFNRWGGLVYKNEDYKNEWNAKGQEAGVYYYEAKIGEETCKGWVQVMK